METQPLQIHAEEETPEFFSNPGADFAHKPTPTHLPPPPRRGREEKSHGEQHIQVPLRRLLRRRLHPARRPPLRRRARPRHTQLPPNQAGSGWAQPACRLLPERAGQLVQEAASGMEEGQADTDDAGGRRAARRAHTQEPSESRCRGLPRILRPTTPKRGGSISACAVRSPDSPHAQASQGRAAHAPGGRQGGGGRRHGHRVRGRVRARRVRQRAGRHQEGRGGADQGSRCQELPPGRRAPEDHRRRGIQASSERQGPGGAGEEVQDQAKWDRRAGERDAVRQGGEGGAAEAGGGEVPDGACVRHRPLRQVRRRSPRRWGVRAGANVEERLRMALRCL